MPYKEVRKINIRIAKKICKNKDKLRYTEAQIKKAERIMLEAEMIKHIVKLKKEIKMDIQQLTKGRQQLVKEVII